MNFISSVIYTSSIGKLSRAFAAHTCAHLFTKSWANTAQSASGQEKVAFKVPSRERASQGPKLGKLIPEGSYLGLSVRQEGDVRGFLSNRERRWDSRTQHRCRYISQLRSGRADVVFPAISGPVGL